MSLVRLPENPIRCRNFIGGEFVESDGQLQPVESPYTGTSIGEVPESTEAEVDHALSRARAAFPAWRDTPIKERTRPLFRFRQLAHERLEELTHTVAAESGKTVAESRAGILKGLEVAEFALSQQNMDSGGAMEVSRGVTCRYRREPLGVVTGIAPFNFPAMVPLWMYPTALALGNCFVLKPSEKVPLTSQIMTELLSEAGFPPGTFSLVNGGRETVERLIDHPTVGAVAFVGSTPAARSVYIRATSHGKRALTLGGAKNHIIVTPDAEESLTVNGVVDSFTGCAGQRCMAASLMVAVGGVDSLIEKIADRAREKTLGTNMGAIIDADSRQRIEGIIDRAEKQGARVLVDGRKATAPNGYESGHWIGPTILDRAEPGMECADSEIFGPVLTIVRRPKLSEALDLENQNPYGNATSVFTTSGGVAQYVSERASNGMIGVNIGVPVPREPFSFGGTKASKFGHGDITGESSLDFWSEIKKITTKWAEQPDRTWMS